MRSVNTRFWDDSFIQDLNTEDKLLFLYLLTNPLTSLLGIYETTIKRIVFDTGLSKETVLNGLERFERVGKAFFRFNHIILPNFLKNQNLNSNMKKGVVKIFNDLPNELKVSILGNGSQSISNDYQSILNGLVKYEIEIESEIKSERNAKNPPETDFTVLYDERQKRDWYNEQITESNYDPHYLRFVETIFNQYSDSNLQNIGNEPLQAILSCKNQLSFRHYKELRKIAEPKLIIEKLERIESVFRKSGKVPAYYLKDALLNFLKDKP